MGKRFFGTILIVGLLAIISAFTYHDGGKKPAPKKTSPKKKKVFPSAATVPTDSTYYIIIDKSDYELKVYDAEGWLATYPIVFGSKDLSDKMMEGDKRTPTGTFKVILKKVHPQWSEELLLDYPTAESYERFKDRKAKGVIPKNARIGGGIAIHATRPQEEWTVDNFYNWTDGCISLKYTEMKDLYSYIPVGTVVKIQP